MDTLSGTFVTHLYDILVNMYQEGSGFTSECQFDIVPIVSSYNKDFNDHPPSTDPLCLLTLQGQKVREPKLDRE